MIESIHRIIIDGDNFRKMKNESISLEKKNNIKVVLLIILHRYK